MDGPFHCIEGKIYENEIEALEKINFSLQQDAEEIADYINRLEKSLSTMKKIQSNVNSRQHEIQSVLDTKTQYQEGEKKSKRDLEQHKRDMDDKFKKIFYINLQKLKEAGDIDAKENAKKLTQNEVRQIVVEKSSKINNVLIENDLLCTDVDPGVRPSSKKRLREVEGIALSRPF